MSRMWSRLLVIVIILEVLAIGGIVAWAKMQPPSSSGTVTVHKGKKLNPPNVTPVLYASGFDHPTNIVASGIKNDKRLYVTEQQGVIRVIGTDGKVAAQPFLDIKSIVNWDKGEMGLLGLAFHPKFQQNGYFYADYNDKDRNTIIARFQIDKKTGLADPASRKVLLTIAQPYPNHKGGQLAFGPDGYLYIGMGDGGSGGDPGNRGQDLSQLLGKLLRIDVDGGDPYTVPVTNPFVSQKGEKQEIWAYGLRNPWRFSFDRQTGDLYIADVGQGNYEEIDFQKAKDKGGENYGWRCYEATHTFNTAGCQDASHYTMPVVEYDHTNKRCSVTGGYVYRGTNQAALVGKYFYADFCSGTIYYTQQQQNEDWEITAAASTPYSISTFGQANDGELYVADITSGTVYHLTDAANKP